MRLTIATILVSVVSFGAFYSARAGDGPSRRDVHVMALNMYHEARGEGRLGMLAVGWVVLNRMADEAYPKTVAEVVYQGCQFSWVCDRRSDRPRDQRSWRRALELAGEILSKTLADPTRGAMWYHASWLRHPPFGAGLARVARIGRHIFYARAGGEPRPAPRAARLYARR